MKALRYLWNIIINIIELLIIIWIFTHVSDWFETIVVSLLILIYVTIEFYIISNWYAELRKIIWFMEEFLWLRILLKDTKLINFYDNEDDIYKENLEKPKENLEWFTPRFYVSMVFSFIFYLICVINLLKTISN